MAKKQKELPVDQSSEMWVQWVFLIGFTKHVFSAVDYSSMSAIKSPKLVS